MKPIIIAVEGRNFVNFLARKIGDGFPNIALNDFKEKGLTLDRWLRQLRLMEDYEDIRGIGIICDAEEDAQKANNLIQGGLKAHKLPCPLNAHELLKEKNITVGYCIVSGADGTGCLEHALLESAPDTVEKRCAESFVDCLSKENKIKNENYRAKVQVRTMIAAQGPDMLFHDSAQTSLWNWEHPALNTILQFLEKMNHIVVDSE